MSVEIRVPSLGESVTEATVARWFKNVGEEVAADEPIVELETEKVTLEHRAPASGTLAEILVEEGGEVEVGALLGSIDDAGAGARAEARPTPEARATGQAGQAGSGRGDGEARGWRAATARPGWRLRYASCSRSTVSIRTRSRRAGPRATSPRATCSPPSRPCGRARPDQLPRRSVRRPSRPSAARETATTPERPAPSPRAAVQEAERGRRRGPSARRPGAPSRPGRPASARSGSG